VIGLLLFANGSIGAGQPSSAWPIVELRQYTLHPGQRDVLIALFEAEFVESQEDVGMKIVGTFRDLDNPDRFVSRGGHAPDRPNVREPLPPPRFVRVVPQVQQGVRSSHQGSTSTREQRNPRSGGERQRSTAR